MIDDKPTVIVLLLVGLLVLVAFTLLEVKGRAPIKPVTEVLSQ